MKKFISLLLVCLMVVPFGMLATTGVSADTAKTVYVSDNGDDAKDGSAADKAVKTMTKAYELLGTAGGTIVIADTYTQAAHFLAPEHTGKVTIKGATADAQYNINASARFVLGGPTEFDSFKYVIKSTVTWMIVCRFNDFTVNETVVGNRNGKDCIAVLGVQSDNDATKMHATTTPKDATLTLNGGDWTDVIGLGRNGLGTPSGTPLTAADFEGVDLTINIGGNVVLQKLYLAMRSVGTTYAQEFVPNASCTVNLNGGTIGQFACLHDIKTLNYGFAKGATFNIGKDFDISKSFTVTPVAGVYSGISGDSAWDATSYTATPVGKTKIVCAEEVYSTISSSDKVRVDSFASVEKAVAQTPDQPGDTPSTGDMTWVVAVVAAAAVMGSAVVLKKREN